MSTDDTPTWTPTAPPSNRCQNCNTHVTPAFVRVYGTDDGILFHCPSCPGIANRDMSCGAGQRPEYDPRRDRRVSAGSESHPIFLAGGEP